ncbi:LacI family transcriptional regulator [Thermobispora bispora]|uniref:Transcriptional regulator, LacI family n=1 Tax=Thermobispora bispora (strain ATCC 19993 / DSM 43833 / CBS 139.67 / JCM 10125 / KCTC 9307 / NBRC 14880 / R51) TaxID=469371 RepID=D6Y6J0_THEBD|nr:LacI family DNA-binding transcriptional regulator [Thermobispora bispora]MBO2472901.1 LacI family transcriptional regulator [Actinomycetales bacterium]MDI9582127.1 LacI family DNA-binding transcriptional regulator [Thermobispora sp.]ADG87562.1 transcriptional regulator, LacI family [Thermobispora bispora DSM 43833]MBX6167140.1 LacI family DNA-binding transcriptional regulator [Thermobispora bispora]QSI47491.1 LacI family transcriptional regulator [Thermobispora bispora]
MKRPTLEEVAARAGVSRATVSRVVNGRQTVTPEIRESVLRAIQELGYVPNSAARSLVTQRTDSVALVVSEPPTRVFSDDPMFSTVIRSASLELEKADRQVVLMLASSPRSHARIERFIAGGHVDGVMLISMHGADPLPAALARMGVPVVSYGRPAVPVPLPYVDNDNVGGAELAVRHLLERGRRRIATIAGPQDMIAGQDRLTGYRNALRGSDRRSIVAVGDFTRESGAVAMRHLLEDDPGLDAVFAANDMMAIGALQTLRQAGRRVPDDVAVVGFDDIEAARYTEPPLTTVRHPVAEQAAAMVRLLLNLFDGGPADPVILPTELVVRESA